MSSMKDNGNPNCASRDGRNGSRPASTYKGMRGIDNALASTPQTGGRRMSLVIAIGRQVGLDWEGSSARLMGKSGSGRREIGWDGHAVPQARV